MTTVMVVIVTAIVHDNPTVLAVRVVVRSPHQRDLRRGPLPTARPLFVDSCVGLACRLVSPVGFRF